MTASILIAYATKNGSTQEVAVAIAEELRARGREVEVQVAREIQTLEGYQSIILGAPIYMGLWHRDAHAFLRHYHKILLERPVVIFALGPTSPEVEQQQAAHTQLDRALAKHPWLTPTALHVFGGAVDPDKLPFPFNHMPKSDVRDWETIRAWARTIASVLPPERQPTQVGV
jgi:menaquinone-dependent protoporphyrinogen oxidase